MKDDRVEGPLARRLAPACVVRGLENARLCWHFLPEIFFCYCRRRSQIREENGSKKIGRCSLEEILRVCCQKPGANEMHFELQLSQAEGGGVGSRRRNWTTSRASYEAQSPGDRSLFV